MPPSTTRSSCSSTRLSSRADSTLATVIRWSAVNRSGSSASRPAASDSRTPTVAALSCARSSPSRVSGTSAPHLDHALLDPAGAGDQHDAAAGWSPAAPARRAARVERDSEGYCTTATWRVSCASRRTVRATMSSRSIAPAQERLDRLALGRRQRLDGGEPVDEQPVALVGGDPPGAGVRLGDVALVLERGHVVADRGRRDAQVVPLDQRLGAHRLVRRHVVLDDRAEHVELAVLQHAHLPVVRRRSV